MDVNEVKSFNAINLLLLAAFLFTKFTQNAKKKFSDESFIMPSCTFNSICIAAVLLASPTVAQLGSNWDITHISTTTTFQQGHGAAKEYIKLTYLIDSGRDWNITLYTDDCTSPLDMLTPNPYDVQQGNLVTRTNDINPAEDQLEILIDLDKLVINGAPLALCVSLQLWSLGVVMKEE